MNFLTSVLNLIRPKKPELRLHKYTDKLFIACGNLLLASGYEQQGNYCFRKKGTNWGRRTIFIYRFYSDGITANVYYPQESMRLIKNIEEMQALINRFKDEK